MESEYLIEWFNDVTGKTGDIVILAKSILDAEDKFFEEFKDGYSIVYIGRIYG